MDLNADGHVDILSGTYSRMESDMAGTFQVLWGSEDGFKKAETLNGTDDEPLIIPTTTEDELLEKICTRPFAVDIDADGDLDLIVGNFGGTFYTFTGEGEGKFAPQPEIIKANDKPLRVKHHSDPFLVDWDQDGDFDIVSGSSAGGVHLAINEGSTKGPRFGQFNELMPGIERDFRNVKLGDAHITGPQSATRVWVDDVNEDGKLDILVGDSVNLAFPAEGLSNEEALAELKEWIQEQDELTAKYKGLFQDADSENGSEDERSEEEQAEEQEPAEEQETKAEQPDNSKEMQEYQEAFSAHYAKRSKIVQDKHTGYVWVYYQK